MNDNANHLGPNDLGQAYFDLTSVAAQGGSFKYALRGMPYKSLIVETAPDGNGNESGSVQIYLGSAVNGRPWRTVAMGGGRGGPVPAVDFLTFVPTANAQGIVAITLSTEIWGTFFKAPASAIYPSLEQLSDVSISGLSNDQVLAFNYATSKWNNLSPSVFGAQKITFGAFSQTGSNYFAQSNTSFVLAAGGAVTLDGWMSKFQTTDSIGLCFGPSLSSYYLFVYQNDGNFVTYSVNGGTESLIGYTGVQNNNILPQPMTLKIGAASGGNTVLAQARFITASSTSSDANVNLIGTNYAWIQTSESMPPIFGFTGLQIP